MGTFEIHLLFLCNDFVPVNFYVMLDTMCSFVD
jgi:hypothetical protein